MRLLAYLVLGLALFFLAGAASLVMIGASDQFGRKPLLATVEVSPFALPSSYVVDPAVVSEELVARLSERSRRDFALRTLLGEEANALLRDRALPRLVNAGVIRRMLAELEGLGTVIAMQDIQSQAHVTLANRGDMAMTDIALVIEATGRADGLPLVDLGDGRSALRVDELAPGEAVTATLWLTVPVAGFGGDIVRVGAAGLDGQVRVYSEITGWNGADLQIVPWARWVATGLLWIVAAAGLAIAALAAIQGVSRLIRV